MMRQRHLKWLLLGLSIVLLIPSAIVIASMILSAANESAGWLRYKLPEIFFWMFLTTGLASPFLGISTLLLLWAQRHQCSHDDQQQSGAEVENCANRSFHGRSDCAGSLDLFFQ